MASVQIIFASTSGHTQYVVEQLQKALADHKTRALRVEDAAPDDLLKGDILILGSGTWNTGGVEGQLNPHMHAFLNGPAKDVDLRGKPCTVIALGDSRYFYTARAGEHLRSYIVAHGGKICCDPLTVVDEPYGQETRMEKWAAKFSKAIQEKR